MNEGKADNVDEVDFEEDMVPESKAVAEYDSSNDIDDDTQTE